MVLKRDRDGFTVNSDRVEVCDIFFFVLYLECLVQEQRKKVVWILKYSSCEDIADIIHTMLPVRAHPATSNVASKTSVVLVASLSNHVVRVVPREQGWRGVE